MTARTLPARSPSATRAGGSAQREAGIAPRQLTELTTALDRERRSLQAQIRAYEAAQLTLSVAQREDGGPGSAPGDVASDVAEEALVVALQRADCGRLALVERARARVATGTYGLCERRGLPIGYPRLHALPWTPTCRACAGLAPAARLRPGPIRARCDGVR